MPRQQGQTFAHMRHGVDVKPALRHRLLQVAVQHQVAAVALWNQDPLLAVQAHALANAEVALNLFVDAAHRQHLTMLVDRPRDRNALLERQAGQ